MIFPQEYFAKYQVVPYYAEIKRQTAFPRDWMRLVSTTLVERELSS